MLIIEHKINTIRDLRATRPERGVEIDVRHDNRTGRLYLNHDPGDGEDAETYLRNFRHAFIIFDIKEAGIEKRCVELALRYGIPPEKYFLLDVEIPFLYAVTRGTRADGFRTRNIAARFSEAEPIEMALAQRGFVDWAWIDTMRALPLDERTAPLLMRNFKTCMVSPDRWRPEKAKTEIPEYRARMAELRFAPDAVMAGKEFGSLWQ